MKQLIILFLLLFTCVFSQTKTDFEVHNLKLDEIIRLDDFLLQHYSDSYWQVEIRLSNVSKSQYVEWVNIRYNFWQSGQLVGSEYSYLDYDTYENTGLKPDSFGLIQSLTEIISFDSINFDIEYYFHDGSNLSLDENALKLKSTNFQDLSYSDVYSKWIGAVLNDTNTPIKYPYIFACFYRNGKLIDLHYTYLDVSNSALEPRKTGYFDTLIILPAEYDSVKYYTHYSISLSGTIDLPVELTDFSVQLHEDNIELTWSTLAEKNNYAFEIERKIEAKDW
ncbi:MAG: hypothetical protein EHM72_15885, partial [Calditrichaeota bacterium]